MTLQKSRMDEYSLAQSSILGCRSFIWSYFAGPSVASLAFSRFKAGFVADRMIL